MFTAESKENPEGGDEAEKEKCNNQDCKEILFSLKTSFSGLDELELRSLPWVNDIFLVVTSKQNNIVVLSIDKNILHND